MNIFSFIGALTIMGLIFYMIIQTSWLKIGSSPDKLNELATLIATSTLVLSGVTLIITALSFCLLKYDKKVIFRCSYGLITFILALAYIVVAIALISFVYALDLTKI